jgi:Reverse transcriptase (RNA-dependent DNA polymerase)
MQREIDAHTKNKTWTLVSRENIAKTEGRKTYFISSLWRYRIKTENGIIMKYKARLCANGATMSCDPHDTFSPVSRITTIRTMMALAAMKGVSIWSGDVPSAYIKADVPPDMVLQAR